MHSWCLGDEWFQNQTAAILSTFSNLALKLRLSRAFDASISHVWAQKKCCLSCIFHVHISAPLQIQSPTSGAITQKSYVGTQWKHWSSLTVMHQHTHTQTHTSQHAQAAAVWRSQSGDGGF